MLMVLSLVWWAPGPHAEWTARGQAKRAGAQADSVRFRFRHL